MITTTSLIFIWQVKRLVIISGFLFLQLSVCLAQPQLQNSETSESSKVTDTDIVASFVKTWQIHNDFNLFLLGAVKQEHLTDLSVSGGRNVGQQFAHIHNTRINWLMGLNPELVSGLSEVRDIDSVTIVLLKESLKKSSDVIAGLLQKALTEGSMKNFKSHPSNFMGYLISHESHHRGQIVLSLKQAGHPVSDRISYGLWNWDKE